ncbi:MAG: P-loop NTPase, partial [Oscillospiraceae bacterium]
MPRALAVTSGKGGTGKSTVSQLVARALCQRGKNVLLLELDSGLRGLDLMMGVTDRVVYDLSDVLCGRCRPAKAIVSVPVSQGCLHLIVAPMDRFFIPDSENLSRLLRGLWACYDLLLLDTAAGLDESFDIATSVCDGALIITNCEGIAVRDAARAASMLHTLDPLLVINRFSRCQLSAEFPHLDAVIDRVGARLISVIPDDAAVERSCQMGIC